MQNSYVDDVAVFSMKWKKHLKDLENVLVSFEKAGMTLKLKKCCFAKKKVSFLGPTVGEGKRLPKLEKVEAIMHVPEPKTKKLLRSFLGMTSFFRSFISMYADIVAPLTELTKEKFSNTVKFTDIERKAFKTVKAELCKCVELHAPDYTKPFIIRSDASALAVGCTLSQVGNDDIEYPLAFASSKLKGAELNWSTIIKEAYSIIFALKRFDPIVFLSKITLYTDHSPLRYVIDNSATSSKLMRWSLFLTRYDIDVIHIKGRDNIVSDALSRCI